MVESVQKRALRIIFPGLDYDEALTKAQVGRLTTRRGEVCKKFIRACTVEPVKYCKPYKTVTEHGYSLRSNNSTINHMGRTDRYRNFVTIKYCI